MAAEKSGEFRGKSVEAAISNGLAALGLSREQVDVEVVRPGSRGLLGIGAEDAVVRLTPGGQRAEPVVKAEPRPEPAPVARTEPAPAKAEPKASPRPEPKPARSRTAPRSEPSAEGARPAAGGSGTTTASSSPVASLSRTGDVVEDGKIVLTRMLEYMNLRAQVEVVPQSEIEAEPGEETMVLNIVGDDLGILIGRQSEVLSALQFLTRLMVNQQSHSRTNLVVDVNGYKSKRAESLRKLALRTADQVMQTGRTMALEPMPPAERRIVHIALRDHPSVSTQSVGEGSKRKVTIVPKKA
jgi:spoIIIJ-associated protein